jgi:hypothetical protein
MLKTHRIEVETIFGTLSAEINGDPAYPGITICIRDREKENGEKQLARVEATPDSPKGGVHSLRLLAYNSDGEDFTDDFTFYEADSANAALATEWVRYTQYLKNWAETHGSPMFAGCCPACFDEWRNCEGLDEDDEIIPKYVVQGCKEITHEDETFIEGDVPDGEAEFWGIYRKEDGEYIHMTGADFTTKDEAVLFAENMNQALQRKGLLQ